MQHWYFYKLSVCGLIPVYNGKFHLHVTIMQASYLRYQDDIIILCKTKRQMNRCKQRLMEVLHERELTLSRKKTRMGKTNASFHFLGIHYPGTQTLYNTKTTGSNETEIDNCMHGL